MIKKKFPERKNANNNVENEYVSNFSGERTQDILMGLSQSNVVINSEDFMNETSVGVNLENILTVCKRKEDDVNIEINLNSIFNSSFPSYLNNEMNYLLISFFENEVSKKLCIGPQSSNYLTKTFLSIAFAEESVFNVITSWVDSFLNLTINYQPCNDTRLKKAYNSMVKRCKSIHNLDLNEIRVFLCFNMVLIGHYVCSGDTVRWRQSFNSCKNLINLCGGFLKIFQKFKHCNDILFFLHNFQYHDIMNSVSNMNGLSFPIFEYEVLLKDINSSYGIDPFQGIVHPLYLILGEIINAKIAIQSEDEVLNDHIWGTYDGNKMANELFSNLKEEYLIFVSKTVQQISSKIENCSISEDKRRLLELSDESIIINLQIFDIYKDVCRLYLNLYVKRAPPSTYDNQFILHRLLKSLHNVIDSKMVVVMCLPLLIAGIVCIHQHEKDQITTLFNTLQKRCPVNNIQKAWEIVVESWKRNPNGNICVDWSKICDDYNWDLCVT